jgi:hypothetical protein
MPCRTADLTEDHDAVAIDGDAPDEGLSETSASWSLRVAHPAAASSSGGAYNSSFRAAAAYANVSPGAIVGDERAGDPRIEWWTTHVIAVGEESNSG